MRIQPEEVRRKSKGNRAEGDHASFCLCGSMAEQR